MRMSDWSSDVCSSDLASRADGTRRTEMAVTGVLRPGYVQLRVLDLEEAILHYRDRIGLNLVSVEGGRAFFQAFDEFDRHSIILCERSEERRVGKECDIKCKLRGWPVNTKKK